MLLDRGSERGGDPDVISASREARKTEEFRLIEWRRRGTPGFCDKI